MPLKKQSGEMYDWVDATWNPLAGECEHDCSYCYMRQLKKNPILNKKYSGKYRYAEKEWREKLYKYGEGITIFVQNCGDLFARGVPHKIKCDVLEYCGGKPMGSPIKRTYPKNTYLFQSKNPSEFSGWLGWMPPNRILGTTIETNRVVEGLSKAPDPIDRFKEMSWLRERMMISIEPVLKFDLRILLQWIDNINPEFVSVGADSKNNGLEEPTEEEVVELVINLKSFTEVKIKSNLRRLAPSLF